MRRRLRKFEVILFVLAVIFILTGCLMNDSPTTLARNDSQVENDTVTVVTSDDQSAKSTQRSNLQTNMTQPDETPQLSVHYLTNPARLIQFTFVEDEFHYYQLPYNENEFLIQFSKPMNQQSVESVVLASLHRDVVTEFLWQDTQSVIVRIQGPVSEDIHTLSFYGAKDLSGEMITKRIEIRFRFVQPKAFFTYDLDTGLEQLLYEPKLAIDDADLNYTKQFVYVKDKIGEFFDGPFYTTYAIDLQSFSWLQQGSEEYDAYLSKHEEYRLNSIYNIFFAETRPTVEGHIAQFAESNNGIIFSPDGLRAAIFLTDKQITELTPEQRYAIDLNIYDVATGELLQSYTQLFWDIFEYDGTDAPVNEKYLHYKPKHCYWFNQDTLLIEFLSEDEQVMYIGRLDVMTGDFEIIASNRIDPVLSPSGKYFVTRVWNESRFEVMDVAGNVIHAFTAAKANKPIWSDDGQRLLYYDEEQNLVLLDLATFSHTSIGSNMSAAGWYDDHILLIYKEEK